MRFLAPQKLEIEPGLKNSQITYKHWKTTFLHFVKLIEANGAASTSATTPTTRPAVDKFGLLVNYIAPGSIHFNSPDILIFLTIGSQILLVFIYVIVIGSLSAAVKR